MPQTHNAVWRLHGDAQKREYTLTVEYYSSLPPADHERAHEMLRRQAEEWLVAQGLPTEQCQIIIQHRRAEPQASAESPPDVDETEQERRTRSEEQDQP